jgi:hypothetical protein
MDRLQASDFRLQASGSRLQEALLSGCKRIRAASRRQRDRKHFLKPGVCSLKLSDA